MEIPMQFVGLGSNLSTAFVLKLECSGNVEVVGKVIISYKIDDAEESVYAYVYTGVNEQNVQNLVKEVFTPYFTDRIQALSFDQAKTAVSQMIRDVLDSSDPYMVPGTKDSIINYLLSILGIRVVIMTIDLDMSPEFAKTQQDIAKAEAKEKAENKEFYALARRFALADPLAKHDAENNVIVEPRHYRMALDYLNDLEQTKAQMIGIGGKIAQTTVDVLKKLA